MVHGTAVRLLLTLVGLHPAALGDALHGKTQVTNAGMLTRPFSRAQQAHVLPLDRPQQAESYLDVLSHPSAVLRDGVAVQPPSIEHEFHEYVVSSPPSPTLIVDVGSGYTRGKVFDIGDRGVVKGKTASHMNQPWQQTSLATVLALGPAFVSSWLNGLMAVIEESGSDKVVISATGGFREAVLYGAVTVNMLEDFKQQLAQRTQNAEFRFLSQQQEASAELEAVQYVASFSLPPDATHRLGFISGGGYTSQVAYYPDGAETASFLSLNVDFQRTAKLMIEGDLHATMQEFAARLETKVAETGLAGKLKGTFAVTELLAYLDGGDIFPTLTALNLGKRFVTKQEATKALNAHMEAWSGRTSEVVDFMEANDGLIPLLLLGLLSLLEDNAMLYIGREWEVAPGRKLQPDWSLGLFVETLPPHLRRARQLPRGAGRGGDLNPYRFRDPILAQKTSHLTSMLTAVLIGFFATSGVILSMFRLRQGASAPLVEQLLSV